VRRFITDFTDGWLNLRDIAATTPDQKLYPEFDEQLQFSMLQETRAFITELFARDLPPANLVASDFAMLNERLARHYGIPGVTGTADPPVKLPPDSHRGGLLTQGSVLKVSANGTSTSPVIRGVYVMERLLRLPAAAAAAGCRRSGTRHPRRDHRARAAGQAPPPRELQRLPPHHRSARASPSNASMSSAAGAIACARSTRGSASRPIAMAGGSATSSALRWMPAAIWSGVGSFHDFEDFRTLLLSQQERITANLAARLLSFGTGT
jgi:hypothetical protein